MNSGDYKVSDLTLADFGRNEIRLAEHEMPGLMASAGEFAEAQPLRGARIAGSLHMTIQTAVLIETLVALGADVRWVSCNIFSTQDHAAAAVVVGPDGTPEAPAGVPVFAWKGETLEEYWWCTEQLLEFTDGSGAPVGPNMILDDGGDATLLVHKGVEFERAGAVPASRGRRPARVRGHPRCAAAQPVHRATRVHPDRRRASSVSPRRRPPVCTACTSSPAAGELLFPAINVNDSVTKSKFDNKYGCRHSLIDGINRATDVLIGGKVASSSATATSARAVPSHCAARARGSSSPRSTRSARCRRRWTATRSRRSTRSSARPTSSSPAPATRTSSPPTDMAPMKHQAIVGNIGHFDNEIDMAGLESAPRRRPEPRSSLRWTSGSSRPRATVRALDHRAERGPPAEPRQRDRAPELRDVELLHQPGHRPDRALHASREAYATQVYVLPKHLDEKVARLHLDALGVRLTTLSKAQAEYIGVDVEGPYKSDHYRY